MLIFTPVQSFQKWQSIPWVTLALALMIVSTFAMTQLDDKSAQHNAKWMYFNNGLAQIELPQYVKFMQRYVHFGPYYNTLEGLKNETISNVDLYHMSALDPLFQKKLKEGSLIKDSHPKKLQWLQLSREYNYLLSQDQVHEWGFKTANPSWKTFFLNGLVHEHWSLVLINVFLLLILGLHLEQCLGSSKYFFSLLLMQTFSWAVCSLAYPYSLFSITGVTGLVAGLTLFYSLYFSGERVQFFVNVVHYREVIQGPAFVVLLLWGGLNGLETWLVSVSPTTWWQYGAGLFAGLGTYLVFKDRTVTQDQSVHQYQSFQKNYDDALRYMNELNFPKAKKILFDLHQANPNHLDVLFQLFNVTKMDPGSEDYHLVVQKIFALKFNTKAAVSMMNIVFKNYVRKAEPSIRFDPKTFLSLSQKFRKYGYLKDSEQILKVLIQTDKKKTKSEFLAGEQLALARAHLANQDPMNATRILDWCFATYPETVSGREAKLLTQKHLVSRF